MATQSFSPLGEENWWDTPEGREEATRIEAEIKEIDEPQDPVLRWMRGIRFFSSSTGRGRKRRKYPISVTLLQFNGDSKRGRWRTWTGEDRDDRGRIPWDKWVTEVFGEPICIRISSNGTHPDDYLRKRVEELLQKNGGRF